MVAHHTDNLRVKRSGLAAGRTHFAGGAGGTEPVTRGRTDGGSG